MDSNSESTYAVTQTTGFQVSKLYVRNQEQHHACVLQSSRQENVDCTEKQQYTLLFLVAMINLFKQWFPQHSPARNITSLF